MDKELEKKIDDAFPIGSRENTFVKKVYTKITSIGSSSACELIPNWKSSTTDFIMDNFVFGDYAMACNNGYIVMYRKGNAKDIAEVDAMLISSHQDIVSKVKKAVVHGGEVDLSKYDQSLRLATINFIYKKYMGTVSVDTPFKRYGSCSHYNGSARHALTRNDKGEVVCSECGEYVSIDPILRLIHRADINIDPLFRTTFSIDEINLASWVLNANNPVPVSMFKKDKDIAAILHIINHMTGTYAYVEDKKIYAIGRNSAFNIPSRNTYDPIQKEEPVSVPNELKRAVKEGLELDIRKAIVNGDPKRDNGIFRINPHTANPNVISALFNLISDKQSLFFFGKFSPSKEYKDYLEIPVRMPKVDRTKLGKVLKFLGERCESFPIVVAPLWALSIYDDTWDGNKYINDKQLDCIYDQARDLIRDSKYLGYWLYKGTCCESLKYKVAFVPNGINDDRSEYTKCLVLYQPNKTTGRIVQGAIGGGDNMAKMLLLALMETTVNYLINSK